MARYHGKDARIYCSTTAAGAAVVVVGTTGWTYDGSSDKADATAQGDTNKIQVLGLANAGGTFSFIWDDTDSTLFEAAESEEACRMYLYKDVVNAPTVYRYGTAYIDISDDANNTSAVSGSGTYSAAGSWSRKP